MLCTTSHRVAALDEPKQQPILLFHGHFRDQQIPMFRTFAVLLALLSSAMAHGYVGGIAIDGKWYAGNQPNNYKGWSSAFCYAIIR